MPFDAMFLVRPQSGIETIGGRGVLGRESIEPVVEIPASPENAGVRHALREGNDFRQVEERNLLLPASLPGIQNPLQPLDIGLINDTLVPVAEFNVPVLPVLSEEILERECLISNLNVGIALKKINAGRCPDAEFRRNGPDLVARKPV